MTIGLVCWSCGRGTPIEVDQPPRLACEVASWANDVGWIGFLDMEHSRALVFCSRECFERQKTKRGTLRLRPVKVEASNGK